MTSLSVMVCSAPGWFFQMGGWLPVVGMQEESGMTQEESGMTQEEVDLVSIGVLYSCSLDGTYWCITACLFA